MSFMFPIEIIKSGIYNILDVSTKVSFASTCKEYITFRGPRYKRKKMYYLELCCLEGNMELIKWVSYKKNQNWSPRMISNAIIGNNIHILVFLLENNCPMDFDLNIRAMKRVDNVDALKVFVKMNKISISSVILKEFKPCSKCREFYCTLLLNK